MTQIYSSTTEIPKINYGKSKCNLDIDHLRVESKIVDSENAKKTGSLNANRFIKVPSTTHETISKYLNKEILQCDWTIEYFKSYEPAGLHTDYISFPNKWITEEGIYCHVVVGIIIPLSWNCKQPYTITYDRVEENPRKLVYRQGAMRYIDTNEPIEYRNSWKYDSEVLKFNPLNTLYYKEYADLHVDFAFEWEIGSMLIFDTMRWHSSSWFLSTNNIPEIMTEYKESIVAFGSCNVKRQ